MSLSAGNSSGSVNLQLVNIWGLKKWPVKIAFLFIAILSPDCKRNIFYYHPMIHFPKQKAYRFLSLYLQTNFHILQLWWACDWDGCTCQSFKNRRLLRDRNKWTLQLTIQSLKTCMVSFHTEIKILISCKNCAS